MQEIISKLQMQKIINIIMENQNVRGYADPLLFLEDVSYIMLAASKNSILFEKDREIKHNVKQAVRRAVQEEWGRFKNHEISIVDDDDLYKLCHLITIIKDNLKEPVSFKGLFDYVLKRAFNSNFNELFCTPAHLVELMTSLADIKVGEHVGDPACGSGSFLVSASEYTYALTGYDINERILNLARFNLKFNNADAELYVQDTLVCDKDKLFDVILCNPPVSAIGKVGYEEATLIDFMEKALSLLKPNGRCLFLVPQGVLSKSDYKSREFRRNLLNNFSIDGVISLPRFIFHPFTTSKASLVVVSKREKTIDSVWFYDLKYDGYTQDNKRVVSPENDIPELKELWSEKTIKDGKSWREAFEIIAENDYILTGSSYRTFVEAEADKESIDEILDSLEKLEQNLLIRIGELKELML